MFVIVMTYQKPLAQVDKYLAAHRDFLTSGYEKTSYLFLARKIPALAAC